METTVTSSRSYPYISSETRFTEKCNALAVFALFIANFVINLLAVVGVFHNVDFTSLCSINLGLALLSFGFSLAMTQNKPPSEVKTALIALSILRLITAALFSGLAFGKVGPFTNNQIMGATYLLSGIALLPISVIGLGIYTAYKLKKG